MKCVKISSNISSKLNRELKQNQRAVRIIEKANVFFWCSVSREDFTFVSSEVVINVSYEIPNEHRLKIAKMFFVISV